MMKQANAPPPPGPYQRRTQLIAQAGSVRARLEDNVHDFEVAVIHDGRKVLSVDGLVRRYPWTTCPFAVDRLRMLVGLDLAAPASVDQTEQCTHMLDLAKLAIAHAHRTGDRLYDVRVVPDASADACHAVLYRDGRKLLDWRVVGRQVVAGVPFEGHLVNGRAEWPPEVLDQPELREAALILRRSLLVYRGRPKAPDRAHRASDLKHMSGACFSFQPSRSALAVRPAGFMDFATAPLEPLVS